MYARKDDTRLERKCLQCTESFVLTCKDLAIGGDSEELLLLHGDLSFAHDLACET